MAASSAVHPNVARYRRMMEAFNTGDLGSVVSDVVAPNVEYVIPGRSPIAGHAHGLPALLELLGRAKERSGGTLRLDLRSVVADDEYLFAYGRVSATRGGKTLDSDHCVVFRFADGKIVEGRTIPVDLYAFDAFWL
jgi:ketosteroid isomerase-like protein